VGELPQEQGGEALDPQPSDEVEAMLRKKMGLPPLQPPAEAHVCQVAGCGRAGTHSLYVKPTDMESGRVFRHVPAHLCDEHYETTVGKVPAFDPSLWGLR
jgi:hypothetical protein